MMGDFLVAIGQVVSMVVVAFGVLVGWAAVYQLFQVRRDLRTLAIIAQRWDRAQTESDEAVKNILRSAFEVAEVAAKAEADLENDKCDA